MTRRTLCGSVLLAGAMMMAATGPGMAQQAQPAQQAKPSAKLGFASADLAATYTPVRAKLAPSNCGCFWLNGASLEGAATFYKGLGVDAELMGGHASNITPGVSLSQISFMAGPRYTYDTTQWTDRFLPRKNASYVFSEALFGGAHAYNSQFPSSTGTTPSASSFSMQLGGGANLGLSGGFGLRLFEVDYVRTTLPNNGSNSQNDLRLAFGVSYRISRH